MRSAYGKHEFMYSNFRVVGIHIWNYILHYLDVNVTLPKLKKKCLKHIFWLIFYIYCLVISIHKAFVFTPSIYYSFLFDIVYYL